MNTAPKHSLTLYYQNTRGLNSKISDCYLNIMCSNYDVIILTETWLKPSVGDTEIFGNNYAVYRCDRNALNSSKPHGGGVLIAVDNRFQSKRISVPLSESLEIVFVKISVNDTNIFIANIYIPSNSPNDVYSKAMKVLSVFFEVNCLNCSINDFMFCVGDFNLPHISWVTDMDEPSVLQPVSSNDFNLKLMDTFSSLYLFQINCVRNFMDRILDLVFCNNYIITT